jgi:threonine 3-dehydrogenase
VEVCELPEPHPRSRDVLIRVRYAGVCGTDLHIADWDRWAQGRIRPPVVLGHEFAGEIVDLGSEVEAEFRLGELVTAEGHIVCGHCRQCRMGDAHICQNTRIIGVDRDGAFADLVSVPASNVVALDGIPATTGAIMDPLGNAFHAVLAGNAVSGARVLVLGCGPIGCFAVGVAKAAGAASIIASDINPLRLELARIMGAHHTLDARRENVPQRVLELTQGEGADLVLEMSGSAEAVKQAFSSVRLGGRVHLLGLPKGEVSLELSNDLIFKGVTVYGVIGRRMFETWHQMQSFLLSGLLDPTPVITHRFPLEAIDDALHAIRSGEAGKVILEIGS